MPEITDQELALYRNGMALLQKLDANAEAKPFLERAIKTVMPNVQTEEDIAARFTAPLTEKVTGLETQLNAALAGLKQRDDDAATAQITGQLTDAFSRLQADGYTPEGLEKIKTLMVERKIADPEAAAALFDRQNPKPAVDNPAFAPSTWEIDSTAAPGIDTKALFANEERWADQEAVNVLNEIRLGKAA